MGDLTPNFNRREFACPCCGLDCIDLHFVATLQLIRTEAGFLFTILSGCRCPTHNASLGGGPAHLQDADGLCKAVDILAETSRKMDIILGLSYKYGIRRRGINNKAVHLDTRLDLSQDVTWTYYKKEKV